MEWISVKDGLPNQDEYVLLYDKYLNLTYEGKLLPSDFYYSDRGGYSKYIGEDCEITHWMPLPEPPKVAMGRRDFPTSNKSILYKEFEC